MATRGPGILSTDHIDLNALIKNAEYTADIVDLAKADARVVRHMTLIRFYAKGAALFLVPTIALVVAVWSTDPDLKKLAQAALTAAISGATGYSIGTSRKSDN